MCGQIRATTTAVQPILSQPGQCRLVVGNWSLSCQKEGEVAIRNSDGTRVSTHVEQCRDRVLNVFLCMYSVQHAVYVALHCTCTYINYMYMYLCISLCFLHTYTCACARTCVLVMLLCTVWVKKHFYPSLPYL